MGYGFISEGETLAFIVSAVFGSSISFFSGLVLLFLIFYYRKHRLSYWRLILGFGIVGILQDVCYFSGAVLIYSEKQDTSYGNFFCKTQGFALQIAGGTSAMYSIMICLHIYFIIVQKWVTIPKKLEIASHLLCWLVGVIVAIIPLSGMLPGVTYGSSFAWCWIASDPKYARFLLFYGWVWFVIVIIIFVYFYVWMHTKREKERYFCAVFTNRTDEIRKMQVMERTLWLFSLCEIAIWAPATLCRVCEALGVDWFPLLFISASVLPWQGSLDLIIFLISSGVIYEMFPRLRIQTVEPEIERSVLISRLRYPPPLGIQ